MAYSVKQLAKMSKVSVRTLHWYDEVGLLKPAYHGANGYRYYEEEQLLLLQQILFYRELGFKLDAIQKVLASDDFDKVKTLRAHKKLLEESIDRTKELVDTIDKTISHLRGEKKMENEEFYVGFDPAKQKEYEKYLVKYHGTQAEDLILECAEKTGKWSKEQWYAVKNEGEAIYASVARSLEAGLASDSDVVQEQIARHYKMVGKFYSLTPEVYEGLAQLYCEHEGFRKFFEEHHADLPEFFAEAMRHYLNS